MTSLYRYFFLFSFFLFGTNQIWAQVKIETSADKKYYEIRNGLLGIMIPAKGLKDETSGSYPAPIQSFIFANGERSDKTINLLKTPNLPTDMQVTVRTNTKDAIVVAVLYKFKKPEFVYGRKFKGGEAGPGYYSCVITVRKNSPSIIFEEESDFDFSYEVGISGGLNPDQARYRGWSSPSVKEGYEKPGAIYRAENERGYPMDATVDLDYSKPIAFAPLTRWEPAGGEYGTGRYWQVYNSKAGTNANLFGFFQGRPSRLFGSISCGVSLAITEQKESAIKVFSNRLAPDLSWFPKKRFEWAAFISSKKDLLAPEKTQPIAIQMNEWSGLGAKVHGYASGKMKIIPAFYEGAIYMPANKVQQLIQQVKRDDRFYQSMLQLDAYFKFPLDMWRFPDSGVTAVRRLLDRYRNTIKDYTVGEGTYKWANRYWIGAIGFKSTAFEISCLFADKSIKISASQRDTLERFISLLARIAWDNDNAPFQDSSGTNWGPANMAFMYRNNARNFFALLLANDKEFVNRAKAVAQQTRKDFEAVIYANGSAIGTPHYMQASIDPVLFTMLQLKQAGVEDQFKNNQRLNRFIDFYTSLLTPPSVRFKSYRKLISFGDGSEENASTFALISAGLHDVDPKKGEQLSFIFENGAPRMNLFGNIAMVTDLTKPHHAQFTGAFTFFPGMFLISDLE